MRVEMGEGLVTTEAPFSDLEALTRLMTLSSEISDAAMALYATEEAALGMKLMETADRLADEVGTLAIRSGYTADEVTQPLWQAPREGCHGEG
jgi:hypothetical protein